MLVDLEKQAFLSSSVPGTPLFICGASQVSESAFLLCFSVH